MAAAALDMHEVRKSQRRHAALLSGVYPYGHPILKRTKIGCNMQNQLVPKFLQDVRKFKGEKGTELCTNASMQDASTQIESVKNEQSKSDTNKGPSSKSLDELKANIENLLNSSSKPTSSSKSLTSSRQTSTRMSTQLSLSTTSESEEAGISQCESSTRQESSHKSISESSPTSIATNTTGISRGVSTGMHHSTSELSTRVHLTGDSATNKTLQRPPTDLFSYMTRGFKFSYFQYCSN